jgi:hypothetical protein
MTQPTPDNLIDPRLHRLDNLGRAAKRSRPYEKEAAVTSRRQLAWRGSSPRPNTPLRPDLDDLLQLNTDHPVRIALPGASSNVQEGSQEDLFFESDSDTYSGNSEDDSDTDSGNSEDDSLEEDELSLVGDWGILADDNDISASKQLVSQESVQAALNTFVGQVFGSLGCLVFTFEMSREAKVAFFSQTIQTTPPRKSLKSSVAGRKVLNNVLE